MKHLLLGGARSGKSRVAEQRAKQLADVQQQQLIYIATAMSGDDEMAARIAKHQSRRGKQWQLLEESTELAKVLTDYNDKQYCILVDCLTLWLSNCLHQSCWDSQQQQLLDLIPAFTADIFFVSNEVGSGIVPMGQLSRDFVDASGCLHQSLATLCDSVTLIVAGLPLVLKP